MTPLRAALALVLAALPAGCGDEPARPRAAAIPTPTATAELTPAPPKAPPGRSVRFRATDGRPHDLLLVSDRRESSSAEGMLEGAVRSRTLLSERPGHGVALLLEPAVRTALLT